jgi:hypothetical protein
VETTDLVEQAAQVCHETIRAYCSSLGDTSLLPWEQAPEDQKNSSRNGVRWYFAQYAAGAESSARAVHERWLKEKEVDGWRYGPTKDPQRKEHPSFVAFDELPLEERRKDYLFAAVCQVFCSSLAHSGQRGF